MRVMDRPHIKKGRTLREAWNAGNYFLLRNRELGIRLDYPQATSPEEAVELRQASSFMPRLQPGTVLEVYRHLPGSQIGATVVEACGTYTVPDEDEGRAFYCSVVDAGRVGYLLGPFDTKEEAEENVSRARTLAESVDPFAYFYSFGVCGTDKGTPIKVRFAEEG